MPSDTTIYDLTPDEEKILFALEGEPRDPAFFKGVMVRIPRLVERELIWFNVGQAQFMITWRGIKNMRARGKRKLMPHLSWKDNNHEVISTAKAKPISIKKVANPKVRKPR